MPACVRGSQGVFSAGSAALREIILCSSERRRVPNGKYTWGLDLSGTFQGAGGIGGLLASEERIC